MSATKAWAESLKIATETDLSPISNCSIKYARTSQEIATRAVILQGVVAVAYGVEAQPIIAWFQTQGIWETVTPNERAFLMSSQRTQSEQVKFRWKQEAEWTL